MGCEGGNPILIIFIHTTMFLKKIIIIIYIDIHCAFWHAQEVMGKG